MGGRKCTKLVNVYGAFRGLVKIKENKSLQTSGYLAKCWQMKNETNNTNGSKQMNIIKAECPGCGNTHEAINNSETCCPYCDCEFVVCNEANLTMWG